jgi:hypothetical protein
MRSAVRDGPPTTRGWRRFWVATCTDASRCIRRWPALARRVSAEGGQPGLAALRLDQLRLAACDSRGLGRCPCQRGAPEQPFTSRTDPRQGQGRGCRRRRPDRGRHGAHGHSVRAQRAGRRCPARGWEHAGGRDTLRGRAPQATPECAEYRQSRRRAGARRRERGARQANFRRPPMRRLPRRRY